MNPMPIAEAIVMLTLVFVFMAAALGGVLMVAVYGIEKQIGRVTEELSGIRDDLEVIADVMRNNRQ